MGKSKAKLAKSQHKKGRFPAKHELEKKRRQPMAASKSYTKNNSNKSQPKYRSSSTGPTRRLFSNPKKKTNNRTASFQLHFPSPTQHSARFIPWMQKRFLSTQTTVIPTTHQLPAPLQNIDPLYLQQLDSELEAFSRYVRLSETEHTARNYLVRNMQRISKELFARSDAALHEEPVSAQVFGSYATPDVCVFSSDIDLALWGVVPVSTVSDHQPSHFTPPTRKRATNNSNIHNNELPTARRSR